MPSFKNTSIRHKQTLIIMLTSSVALLLACAAFVIYDVVNFRRELVGGVSVLAEAIGNNCAAAIDFNDPKTAAATLAALHANERVVSACVYNNDGDVFAIYRRDTNAVFVPPVMQAPAQKFTRDQLYLFRPIKQREVTTGMIFVATDLKDLSARLLRYTGIVGVVFLASLLVALALSSRLQKLVSDPILQLAQVAKSVALEKNYSVRATKQNGDELGQLVDGFNEMLMQIQARDAALQTAREDRERRAEERTREMEINHKKLMETSRQAGMAEVATGVLHNVGNVLNSVNVASSCLADSLRNSKSANLSKVVRMLGEHEGDLGNFLTSDPKGKQLPGYLTKLTEHLAGEQTAALKELAELQKNIEHIKDIVSMQQSFAKVSGVRETLAVSDLVEDALKMNLSSLIRHDIEVVREFGLVAPLSVEKHKVLQILVNLIRNARHACNETGGTRKRLTIRVANGDGRVHIAVSDNGVGIPPANLTRIFNHGFTTKKDGHGFGLHSGALAANEMGGCLTAHSEGTGLGATFTLELPIQNSTHST